MPCWFSKTDKGGADYDQILHSRNCLWLEHLQGARDLILFRGGPRTSDYLTRFFSLLDVSGSLCSGGGPLLQGNYWLDNDPVTDSTGYHSPGGIAKWPYYDFDAVNFPFIPRRSLCQKSLTLLGDGYSLSRIDGFHGEALAIILGFNARPWNPAPGAYQRASSHNT